jgi:putative membrane protein
MINDSFWLKIIYILSVVITLAVALLILGPRPEGMDGLLDVSGLPLLNATLNSTSALLLIIALWFIKKKNVQAHKGTMLAAFGTSSMFLVTYVIYHWFKAGPKAYVGDYDTIYYFILISHIILAIFIIPMALVTLYIGWNMQIAQHRKIAKITYPLWIYVSVTGVVIYMMLY